MKSNYFLSGVSILASFLLVLGSLSFFAYSEIKSEAASVIVNREQKISALSGGMQGVIDEAEAFGAAMDNIGDLDGDGIEDVMVGSFSDSLGGAATGAAYTMFMNRDGTVRSSVKIGSGVGGFGGTISGTNFGTAIANIGDLDGDGVTDVAVGAFTDDDGGSSRGAVWILFMDTDGTVKSEQKISDTAGSFTGTLDNNDFFGRSLAAVGDLDGDGVEDIVAGASGDDDGSGENGALWVLFLDTDGTVKSHQKISATTGGFSGQAAGSIFGIGVDEIGDINGDNIIDLVVGAAFDDDGGANAGAAWVLFLDTDGTVKGDAKLSNSDGIEGLTAGALFGATVTRLGLDISGDGNEDFLIGAPGASTAWVFFVNDVGEIVNQRRISTTEGGLDGTVTGTFFGFGATDIDLGGNNRPEFMIGATSDADGGAGYGAVWTIFANDFLADRGTVLPQSRAIVPVGEDILISEGAACTPRRFVELSLDAIDAREYAVSFDPSFNDSSWQVFGEDSPLVTSVVLPDEDGMQTLYVVYRSRTGNISEVTSTKILLDRQGKCQ